MTDMAILIPSLKNWLLFNMSVRVNNFFKLEVCAFSSFLVTWQVIG